MAKKRQGRKMVFCVYSENINFLQLMKIVVILVWIACAGYLVRELVSPQRAFALSSYDDMSTSTKDTLNDLVKKLGERTDIDRSLSLPLDGVESDIANNFVGFWGGKNEVMPRVIEVRKLDDKYYLFFAWLYKGETGVVQVGSFKCNINKSGEGEIVWNARHEAQNVLRFNGKPYRFSYEKTQWPNDTFFYRIPSPQSK